MVSVLCFAHMRSILRTSGKDTRTGALGLGLVIGMTSGQIPSFTITGSYERLAYAGFVSFMDEMHFSRQTSPRILPCASFSNRRSNTLVHPHTLHFGTMPGWNVFEYTWKDLCFETRIWTERWDPSFNPVPLQKNFPHVRHLARQTLGPLPQYWQQFAGIGGSSLNLFSGSLYSSG